MSMYILVSMLCTNPSMLEDVILYKDIFVEPVFCFVFKKYFVFLSFFK